MSQTQLSDTAEASSFYKYVRDIILEKYKDKPYQYKAIQERLLNLLFRGNPRQDYRHQLKLLGYDKKDIELIFTLAKAKLYIQRQHTRFVEDIFEDEFGNKNVVIKDKNLKMLYGGVYNDVKQYLEKEWR